MVRSRRYLIDTNVLIWWMADSPRLSENIKNLLINSQSEIFLSVVSVWEVVIKKQVGKLRPPRDWKITLEKQKFEILTLDLPHVFYLEKLPFLHKDPFDRMLVAQALSEKLTLITADEKLRQYRVKVLTT
ncbi:MAG: type II toxin-antitoxin system VapC family toxin [Candidatus Chisholmbacteria bacterium]|nr:type II toxin-antitoxin system VapC family toxin [Candidatus Chisholmbacteria bacterium]